MSMIPLTNWDFMDYCFPIFIQRFTIAPFKLGRPNELEMQFLLPILSIAYK